MNTNKALEIIFDFKGNSLKNRINQLKSATINKTKDEITENVELLNAALIVKKASAQINEIVHAIGIINSLPRILSDSEIITDLSLAAGADGEGFDLVTNQRVAEFKFSRWQDGSSKNGMRKRQVFIDFVSLTMLQTDKKKELYVVNAETIIKFFNGRANWENVLSKSGGLKNTFADYLKSKGYNELTTLKDIYEISNVEIFDIEKILNVEF